MQYLPQFTDIQIEPTTAKYLYHYTSEKNASAIEESESIWFVKNNHSNDPKDGHIASLVDEAFQLLENNQGASDDLVVWKRIVHGTFTERDNGLATDVPNAGFLPDFYVACFSETSTNSELWEKYADKSSGRCLKFQSLHIPIYIENITTQDSRFHFHLMGKVSYSREHQIKVVYNVVKNSLRQYFDVFPIDKKRASEIISEVYFELLVFSAFFKDIKWKEENEVRIALFRGWQSVVLHKHLYKETVKKSVIDLRFDYNDGIGSLFRRLFFRGSFEHHQRFDC